MAAPANVFDGFEPYPVVRLHEELAALQANRPGEVAYIRRLEETVAEVQQGRAELAEQVEAAHRELEQARRTAEEGRRRSAALEHRVAELEDRLGVRHT
jgi:chromosome segregation ATPase